MAAAREPLPLSKRCQNPAVKGCQNPCQNLDSLLTARAAKRPATGARSAPRAKRADAEGKREERRTINSHPPPRTRKAPKAGRDVKTLSKLCQPFVKAFDSLLTAGATRFRRAASCQSFLCENWFCQLLTSFDRF